MVKHFLICTFLSSDAQIVTVHLKVSVLTLNKESEDVILEAVSDVSTNNL